ncbi:twin BRCT domain-containing protein [Phthorimaea operculella]|nr:twin BRCT domain-containing protein [Phthorimaea operculella]
MPRVKVDYIVSFSSESPEAPASNLLANEAGKGRWLCARGEPSCSVLLQLSKAVQISSITIGAHLSALVEVLVGRSETPNDPFQVLVASSVFLSLHESRRAAEGDTAADRVRSFTTEQLAADVRGKRWDRVRVVCSQPYNKHCKYGLSFIHIFSPEGDAPSASTSSEPAQKTTKDSTSRPSLKFPADISPQDSDDDDLKPGALFAQHLAKQSQSQSQDSTSSTDSQIRKATSQAIKNVFNNSTKIVRTPISKPKGSVTHSEESRSDRKRESLMYEDEDDGPHDKIDRLVAAHKDQQAKEAEKEKANKEKEKQQKDKERTHKDKTESDSSKYKKERNKDEITHNQTPKDKYKDKTDDKNRTPHSSKKERERSRSPRSSKKERDERSRSPQSSKKEKGERSRSPHSSKRDRTLSNKQDRGDDRSKKVSKDQDNGKTLYAGPVSDKPHELLRDVVFVLSGYENPRRAAVRDAALAMGAQFQRDWNSRCTHLICAFSNTPKLKTVRSSPDGDKAIVVTAEWVERQAERRRRLPWQWFATEHKFRVKRARSASGEDPPGTSRRDSDAENDAIASKDTDRRVKEEDRNRKKRDRTPDSECDTDDEIEKVMRQNAQKRNRINSDEESTSKKKKEEADDVANMSAGSDVAFVCDERMQAQITLSDDEDATDKEDVIEDTPELGTIEQLPSFFEGCTFAVHATNKPILDEKTVRRYVKAYGGEIVETMDEEEDLEVDYVLCLSGHTAGVRAKGRLVRGDWLWRCHERKRLCSPGEFAL